MTVISPMEAKIGDVVRIMPHGRTKWEVASEPVPTTRHYAIGGAIVVLRSPTGRKERWYFAAGTRLRLLRAESADEAP